MRKWRSSTAAAVWWWPSGTAIRTCRSGPWWKATTSHIHGWRASSWTRTVGTSAWRRAALAVAVVILSPKALIITATIFVVTIIALVLVVLLLWWWLIVLLLRTRPTRILPLWRRSWVCHLYCTRGCAASFLFFSFCRRSPLFLCAFPVFSPLKFRCMNECVVVCCSLESFRRCVAGGGIVCCLGIRKRIKEGLWCCNG